MATGLLLPAAPRLRRGKAERAGSLEDRITTTWCGETSPEDDMNTNGNDDAGTEWWEERDNFTALFFVCRSITGPV